MTGACLCGAVAWTTDVELRGVLECHCPRCQRITGNFMAATAVPTSALGIEDSTLSWYSPPEDPNVAYGFCTNCGSSLFYRNGIVDGTNTETSICAGSVNGSSGLRTTAVWFAANAADHVRLDPDLPTFPGQP